MSFLTKSNVPKSRDFFEEFFKDWSTPQMWNENFNSAFTPAVNVKETAEDYIVSAEIPGMKKEDIEVTLRDHALVIKGEKKAEREDNTETYHRREMTYGSFIRTIPFATDIAAEMAKADYKNGVLTVTVAKEKLNRPGNRKLTIE